ncbi:hypothetical protein ANCCAN_12008 [Ancylostoma caninum]|uniref:Uncharacterized protein n=1 Tax=Ancylostoma caninum TaxID=29170 RepID=A0A368GCC8_ANCCA|nr:hypothetical protein ANCCAN_12008 [Ancylostoma caninum]
MAPSGVKPGVIKGLLVFACALVCSILEAIFGRPCQRIDELIENPYIDHHTGMSLVRKLTKGMLSSHADERVLSILSQLCAISFMGTPDATSHSTADYRVPPCSRRCVVLEENTTIEGVMDFEFAKIPSSRAEEFDSCVEEGKGIGDVGPKNAALESPKNLGGNRAQSDSPRVMSPGKAMLHKILSECSSPAAPSSRATSKLEKCDVPLGTVESGSDDLAREQVTRALTL